LKRLYREVGVRSEDAGFVVSLDGRPVRTPAKAALVLPTAALARAVADEWEAQGDEIDPHSMPMMRLGYTAIDMVRPRRARVVEALAAYGETELVCHRAPKPRELAARQEAAWAPLLDWLDETYGVRLRLTAGIAPMTQDRSALERLRDVVAGRDDWALTALNAAVTAAGSVVIGLALADGRIGPAAAFDASQIDETFQIERWGEDVEAAARRRGLAADLEAAARFHALSRS